MLVHQYQRQNFAIILGLIFSGAKVYASPDMPDVSFLPDAQPASFTMRNTVAIIARARLVRIYICPCDSMISGSD